MAAPLPPPLIPYAALPVAAAEAAFSIPTGYGDDRLVAMVKDPWWIFAYWEIQPSTERAVRGQLLPQEVMGLQSVLRVYDVTGIDYPEQLAHRFFDIALSGLATNWYIQTNAPGRQFIMEIGLLTVGGRFLMLARSNRVATPRFGPSDVIDELWATSDEAYWKLFGSIAGLGMGASPTAWAHALSQQLSSGNWSSYGLTGPGKAVSLVRGFWCRVDTDLVLHGMTEPKATVRIQGQPVAVRKDGSFSLRLALPEGTQTITIEVVSADGRHAKTVAPIVTLASATGLTTDTKQDQVSWPRLEPRDGTGGEAS